MKEKHGDEFQTSYLKKKHTYQLKYDKEIDNHVWVLFIFLPNFFEMFL